MEFQIRSGLVIAARELVGCLVGMACFPAGGLDTSPLLGNFVSSEKGGVSQFKAQSSKYKYLETHLSNPNPFIHYFALAHPLSKITNANPIPS
jgi:hypothetical protein